MSNDIFTTIDRDRLERTNSVREIIISDLMCNGVPDTKDDRDFLIRTLDGMDRTILSKAKIKSDDTNAKTQQQAAKLIGDVLSRMEVSSSKTRTTIPELPSSIPLADTVEGELDIGHGTFKYHEFISE